MKTQGLLIFSLLVAGALFAQEKPYSCSLKVENPKVQSSKSTTGGKAKGNGRSNTEIETTTRTMHCETKVSFRGKEIPTGIKLNYFFTGRTDEGVVTSLGRKSVDVKLDEKGEFKTDIVSGPAVWTEKKTKSRGRRGGTRSEGSGTRIGGCVIQLLVGDKVERVYTSKPAWKKLAEKYPLPEAEIMKLR